MRYVQLLTLALLLGATTFVEAQQTNNNDAGSAVERAQSSLGAALGTSSTAGLEAEAVQGSLTGLLTDASSGRALGSAQVFITGTGLGSLSNSAGRYLILNVPVGQHTLEVMLIGYGQQQQQVTVSEGQVTTADFALSEVALSLDEIVVTGTAGQARRREIGNTIASIRADDILEPVQDVAAMLQSRVVGARILNSSGASGATADIRLRGNVSTSMSVQPLIYIDGVRSKSDPYPSNGGAVTPVGVLDDINPSDIERIEIIKGPAATTLYGTEAAGGVIQIFTKSGGQGAPQWTAEIQGGSSYFRTIGSDNGVVDATREAAGLGPCKRGMGCPQYMYYDPVFQTGYRQRYSMSVRGGASDALGYFVSAAYSDNEGGVKFDGQKQLTVRGNTTIQATEDILIQFNNSYSQRNLDQNRLGNTISGIPMTSIRGEQSYMGSRGGDVLNALLEQRNFTTLNRFVSGMTVNYSPGSDFTHRLTVGFDFSQAENERFEPFCWRCAPPMNRLADDGGIDRNSTQEKYWSLDYVGTLGLDLTDNIRSTFSFGVQGVEQKLENLEADGEHFPGPGEYTIAATSDKDADQQKLRVITGGFFGQNMFAYQDKYFLTVGLRIDGNSAFGSGLGLQSYPKVSGSYVMSDEDFFPEGLGELKLRAAYGWAGRAPGAFDAVRTWDPVGYGNDRQAFYPDNVGNEFLGPERTEEWEVGFDHSFLNGRMSTELTYYAQRTTDALFEVNSPQSEGGWNAQLENVGELTNKGIEIMVNAAIVDTRSFRWDLGLGVSTNSSEVTSLGGSPQFSVGRGGWVIEGEPVPVIRGRRIMNFNELADPIASDGRVLYGPSYPPQMWTANTTFGLPGGIRLSARGEYQKGSFTTNYFEAGGLWRNIPHPKCYSAYQTVDPTWVPVYPDNPPSPVLPDPAPSSLTAWERGQCFGMSTTNYTYGENDFFELRDITLSVPISRLFPQIAEWTNTTRSDLTFSARNVWYWTHKNLHYGHPEMNQSNSGANADGTWSQTFVPHIRETLWPQSTFTVALRAIF